MRLGVQVLEPWEAAVRGRTPGRAQIGLALPLSGVLALAGPSALYTCLLAISEVNTAEGWGGLPLDAVLVDAGRDAARTGSEVAGLVGGGLVDGFVALHPSDVLDRVEPHVAGRVPYVFTSGHEDVARADGIHLIGETTHGLREALRRLPRQRDAHTWAVVGTDYVWPQAMARVAHQTATEGHLEVVADIVLPRGFSRREAQDAVERIAGSRARALLVNMPGRDQVNLAHALRSAGLDDMVRLSSAVEENALYAMGGDPSGNLFGVLRSFAGAPTPRQEDLSERLTKAFGPGHPVINSWSESCYDAVHMLAAWACDPGTARGAAHRSDVVQHTADSAWWRGAALSSRESQSLALAVGHRFEVAERL